MTPIDTTSASATSSARTGAVDASIRPNQIFALSLPFPLLSKARARPVLEVVEDHLLRPFGLRSLSPGDDAGWWSAVVP